ncbi:teichuronic acid biosynthesis glycosyltransferase TuaC [Candidatus Magnetomoraceae bacterium gMMP-13]
MNILFLSHMFPNPVQPVNGTFVLDLAKFINRKKTVTVIAPIPYFPWIHKTFKYKGYNMIPEKMNFKGLHVYYPRFFMIPKYCKWLDGLFYTFCCWNRVKSILKTCDIIVAHWTFPDAFAGVVWSRLKKKKIILVVHGNESIHYFDPLSLRKRIIRKTVENVDHIIAVSTDLKEKILRTHKVDANRITVLPNGVDYKKFPLIDQQAARNQLELPVDKRILLTVARLSPEKALDVLLNAFLQLKDLSDTLLYIIGEGPEIFCLKNFIKEKNLYDKVFLLGAIPHEKIHLWMSAADVFLLPSLREGTPVVIGEAFACGTPVVASTVGGIPDLIANDKLGIMVEPNSVPALSVALETAMAKQWDRTYIREFGSKFDWKIIAEKVITILYKTNKKNRRYLSCCQ